MSLVRRLTKYALSSLVSCSVLVLDALRLEKKIWTSPLQAVMILSLGTSHAWKWASHWGEQRTWSQAP